jgi:RND family efflux transporter MFP subunit
MMDTADHSEKKTKRLKLGLAAAGIGVLAVVTIGALVLDLKTYLKHDVRAARVAGTGVIVRGEKSRVERITEVIGANSLVEPISSIHLTARVTSAVKKVNVDVGQLVQKGKWLAELEQDLLLANIKTLEDTLASNKMDLENSRIMLERQKGLYEQGIIAKKDLEGSQLDFANSQATYSTAAFALEKARVDLEKGTIIKAPLAGIIQTRSINPSEIVHEGDSLFQIGRLDKVYVTAAVSEEKIGNVSIGQEAEIVFDAFPNETVRGEVVKIDPGTDPSTKTFKAYVKVDNPDLKYKPGLSAYARLQYRRSALTIPKMSVVTRGGESTVFVVENSKAVLRPVKVEPATFGRVAVVDGLHEGEIVIYYGLLKLKDGDLVQLELLPASS